MEPILLPCYEWVKSMSPRKIGCLMARVMRKLGGAGLMKVLQLKVDASKDDHFWKGAVPG